MHIACCNLEAQSESGSSLCQVIDANAGQIFYAFRRIASKSSQGLRFVVTGRQLKQDDDNDDDDDDDDDNLSPASGGNSLDRARAAVTAAQGAIAAVGKLLLERISQICSPLEKLFTAIDG